MTQNADETPTVQTIRIQATMESDTSQAIMHVNVFNALPAQGLMYIDAGSLAPLDIVKAQQNGAQNGEGIVVVQIPALIRLAMPVAAAAQLALNIQSHLKALGLNTAGESE